jgi:hypothetical protein
LLSRHLVQNALYKYLLLALTLANIVVVDVFRWAHTYLFLLFRISQGSRRLSVVRRVECRLMFVALSAVLRVQSFQILATSEGIRIEDRSTCEEVIIGQGTSAAKVLDVVRRYRRWI